MHDSTSTKIARTDPARVAAVRRYEILDAPTDGTFDDVTALAATVCGTPISTVSIVDTERVWFAACHGLKGVSEVGTEPGLCASAFVSDGPYVVNDAAVDPRTLDHPLVRGALGLRFYAAAPIITADGFPLGTVTVIDRVPRDLTDVQTRTLTLLADMVAKHLELRLAAIMAVRAERELRDDADQRAAATAKLAEQLREAAMAHRASARPAICQLGGADGPCSQPAELKVADSWGDSAWGCPGHVEEALLAVRSIFIANEELGGLAAYINRRSGS